MIAITCEQPSEETIGPDEEDNTTDETIEDNRQTAEENPTNDDDHQENDQLPILPPLILLDFANDLDSTNSSGDEKSKRTIDSNLGYGFGRNNLFNGKYNYYFPAGKSGTAVSIEESISPFPPTTIIESVKPITEKPYPGDGANDYRNPSRQQGGYQQNAGLHGNRQPIRTSSDRYVGAQPVFGQRTKLYKPSQIDYSSYQGSVTTQRNNLEAQTTARPDYTAYKGFGSGAQSTAESYTTARPDYRTQGNTYATANPGIRSGSYTAGFPQVAHTTQRPYAGFSTPAPPAYVTPTSSSHQTRYNINNANSYSTPMPAFEATTTPRSVNHDSLDYKLGSPLSSFDNLPRYTVENGVRYENKIVWKYPDGKISQTPPTSYVNSYNEFLTKENPRFEGSSGNQSPGSFSGSSSANVYQNQAYLSQGSSQTSFRDQSYQTGVRYQAPQDSRYPSGSLGNIYSKSPAQFPKDQEHGKPARPSQFVSAASFVSGADYGIGSRPQEPQDDALDYQGQFGQKNPTPGVSSGSPSGPVLGYDGLLAGNSKIVKDHNSPTNYGHRRPIPKYAINSPNPEYLPKPTGSPSILTPSGTLSPQVLAKYTPQAQRYLTKVFGEDKSATATSSSTSQGAYGTPQIDTSYENLINYNPSISQYIRNPSSILNAQPTYIQAGNSLIPVIILRVDGAPPIRPKTAPNINLKALLQQYLTQYAGTVARDGDYEVGNGDDYGKAQGRPAAHNPLQELAQLTQSLTRYSEDPSIADDLAKRFEGGLDRTPYRLNSYGRPATTNFGTIGKTSSTDGLGKYETKVKPQKVKSVQIIEDPRFTSYKVNS